MQNRLDQLKSFGGTDADSDPLLIDCFEDHPAYVALREGRSNVVLGRKGSGKTAVYLRILKDFPHHSVGINFTDYPWAHHELQKQNGVPEEQCFVESWKYFCLISLCRLVARGTLLMMDGADPRVEHIRSFLRDTYGTHEPEPSQIFGPAQELKFKVNAKANLGFISGGAAVERIPMAHLPKLASEVNNYVRNILFQVLPKGRRFYVLFDQLDHGFSLTADDYRLRLVGLLLACKSLNDAAARAGIDLTCGAFLRDDIYAALQFEDKNKLTQNTVTHIRWDTGNTRSAEPSLKSLMEKRFANVLGGDQSRWDDLFDEAKLMPGKQTKYNYMRERTFLRPRDMIAFCNAVLEAFHHNEAAEGQFANIDIQNAQQPYSDYLLRELDDEIHKHVPNYKGYLEVIRDVGVAQFSRDDFISAWNARKAKLRLNEEPIDALAQLFEFSAIGFLAVGGAEGGSGFVYKYKSERASFNETSQKFRVHWGLKEALGLKRSQ